MFRTLSAAVFASLALHLFLLGFLSRPRIKPSDEPRAISVEFKDSVGVKGASKSPRRSRATKRAQAIPLSALVPRLMLKPPVNQDFTRDPDPIEESGGSSSASAGLTAQESRFITALWRMVDQSIEQNPFLSEYNQTGKVSMRFEIDEQGRLTKLQASAANRVLKVMAARAIRKAILNETGDIQFPPQKMSILADFNWASYEACQSLRGHSGNSLSFCHFAVNKRRKFSTGERVGTWAGAILNHGPWAYEEIQKYNRQESRRKSHFNPFRKYELDPDWNL